MGLDANRAGIVGRHASSYPSCGQFWPTRYSRRRWRDNYRLPSRALAGEKNGQSGHGVVARAAFILTPAKMNAGPDRRTNMGLGRLGPSPLSAHVMPPHDACCAFPVTVVGHTTITRCGASPMNGLPAPPIHHRVRVVSTFIVLAVRCLTSVVGFEFRNGDYRGAGWMGDSCTHE